MAATRQETKAMAEKKKSNPLKPSLSQEELQNCAHEVGPHTRFGLSLEPRFTLQKKKQVIYRHEEKMFRWHCSVGWKKSIGLTSQLINNQSVQEIERVATIPARF